MGFTDTVSYYLDPYRYYYIGFVYALIFFLIICGISYYVYQSDFVKHYNNPGTSDIPNTSAGKGDNSIMFFYTRWCPHCKTARPIWETFSAKYNKQFVNGYKCKFLEYDLTDENNPETKKIMEDYNIEGFPSIKMKIGNDLVEFDAKITPTALEEFIQNVTND